MKIATCELLYLFLMLVFVSKPNLGTKVTAVLFIPFESILSKCRDVIRKLQREHPITGMEEAYRRYLNDVTASQINNPNREMQTKKKKRNKQEGNAPSPLSIFRSNKIHLRKIFSEAFFPTYEVKHEYKGGNTFMEKYISSHKGAIFVAKCPSNSDILLPVFCLLDNIYIPSVLQAFTDTIRESYMGDHAQKSLSNGVIHTKLWDSIDVWNSISTFIKFLTKTIQNEKLWTDWMHKDMAESDLIVVKNKISHSCHQHAFFIVLAIIKGIGLFPNSNVENAVLNNNSYAEKRNIFLLLTELLQSDVTEEVEVLTAPQDNELQLLGVFGNDSTDGNGDVKTSLVTPMEIFTESVISDYWRSIGDIKENIKTFPVTFEAFSTEGWSEKAVRCCSDLIATFTEFVNDFNSRPLIVAPR